MSEHMATSQTSLFPVVETRNAQRAAGLAFIPRRDAREVGLAEAVANAAAAARSGALNEHEETGGSRKSTAHLPGVSGGPEIYALCPGCEVHPDGGIFPATELARAEGCPVGSRLRAAEIAADGGSGFSGREGCRGAEREGSALPGAERRNASLPPSGPEIVRRGARLAAGSITRLVAGCRFLLTTPGRLCSGLYTDVRRRLSRAIYFHRRRAVCRRRLSRIANAPSWSS